LINRKLLTARERPFRPPGGAFFPVGRLPDQEREALIDRLSSLIDRLSLVSTGLSTLREALHGEDDDQHEHPVQAAARAAKVLGERLPRET